MTHWPLEVVDKVTREPGPHISSGTPNVDTGSWQYADGHENRATADVATGQGLDLLTALTATISAQQK